MTAADYMLMAAGVKHVSAAASDPDCLAFIPQDGTFDFALASDD